MYSSKRLSIVQESHGLNPSDQAQKEKEEKEEEMISHILSIF